MKDGTSNVISGFLIIISGLLVLLETRNPAYIGLDDGLGTGTMFFPRILMTIFITMGVMTIFKGIKEKGSSIAEVNWGKITTIILLVSTLFYLVPLIGFLIPTIPFLMISMWAMGYRKIKLIALISIIFSTVIWYLCNFVFEIILPTSPWFHNI